MQSSESSDRLKITVNRKSAGECAVVVTIAAGAFHGTGRAWMEVAFLREFSLRARQLAATGQGEATLAGGYSNPDGSHFYMVSLTMKAIGAGDQIMVHAELEADASTSNALLGAVHRLKTALIVEPAGLERFSSQLSEIAVGKEAEITLPGVAA